MNTFKQFYRVLSIVSVKGDQKVMRGIQQTEKLHVPIQQGRVRYFCKNFFFVHLLQS